MTETARRAQYRILLAEDNDVLRMMLARALTKAGFNVEAVPDGNQARDAYLRECPDVLVADLVMPGINGQELAAVCRAHCDRALLVFMSGYSEEELQRLEIRQVVFIPKPLSPRDLVLLLDRLLQTRDVEEAAS